MVQSYWDSDKISEEDRYSKKASRDVLISGTGDGGLIDLLRYCSSDFRHDLILRRLQNEWLGRDDLAR